MEEKRKKKLEKHKNVYFVWKAQHIYATMWKHFS